MKTLSILSVQIFSPGQIAALVALSVFIVGFAVAGAVLAYLIHKSRERKLHDLELQKKREQLLDKLNRMREGSYEFGEEQEQEETRSEERRVGKECRL